MFNKSLFNFSQRNFHNFLNLRKSFDFKNYNNDIINLGHSKKNLIAQNKFSKKYFFRRTNFLNKNFYEILGVNKESTNDQIKKSYLKLAKQFHPDVNKENGADDKFKNITLAYEELSNENKRKSYDAKMGFNYSKGDFRYNEDEEFSKRNERAKYDKNSSYYKNNYDSNFWGNDREDFEDKFYKDYDNIFTSGYKHTKPIKGDDILVNKDYFFI